MATRPLDLSQERCKGRERKGRKEGRKETLGQADWYREKKARKQLWKRTFWKSMEIETENKAGRNRERGDNAKMKLKPAAQNTSVVSGRRKSTKKANQLFPNFLLGFVGLRML